MKCLNPISRLAVLAAFYLLCVGSVAQEPSLFEQLKGQGGRAYSGRMTYPDDPNHPMNQPMRIEFIKVSEDQIRVPLAVGDDTSRTWVLTRRGESVELKHDHRHADGSPDDVTNYGGVDSYRLLGSQLIFPADEETAALLPEASGNVWSLRLSPNGQTLTYYLERDGKPRFEAVFDLSQELSALPKAGLLLPVAR